MNRNARPGKLGSGAGAARATAPEPSKRGQHPGTPLSVVVVEPLTAIRQLTANFLRQLPDIRVVGEAGDFEEAVRLCQSLRPAVAVIDGFMWSSTQGTSLARALQTHSPTTRILVFCPTASTDVMREAVDTDVAGFVLRVDPAARFEQALRAVGRGEQYFCSEIARLLRDPEHRLPSSGTGATLTARERQVLQEIARGRLSKEIADTLGMSVFGVQNVRRRISRKTGLRTVAQLTLHAAKLRLVPEPGRCG